MNFLAGLRSFYKPCSKWFGLSIWVPILIHWYEYTSGYNTVSFSNLATTNTAVTFSNYINTGRRLGGISPIKVNVQWIYPGSILDSNITEQKLIWLAGSKKNMKWCQIKGSLNSSCQKNNPVFQTWRG